MTRTLITDVRLPADPTASVSIEAVDGVITAVGAPSGAAADIEVDGAGTLALPGLINAHAHIDKTLYGGAWVPVPHCGTVGERIAHERRERDHHGLPRDEFIAALVERMIATGTTHLRTHTDIDPGVGLRGVAAVNEVARRYGHAITIEQVAFPQGGLISNPGTLELLEEAIAGGVGTVGGLDPAGFDNDPIAQLDAIFELAARTGCRIDIHLHDDGTLGVWQFRRIMERTRSHGLAGKVAISHAFAIGHEPTQAALIAELAESGVALITAAVYNVPVPPVAAMAEAGVPLAAGTDGIRDLWGPYGDGDMLQRAMLVGYRCSERTDRGLELALATATHGAATVLGLPDYGVEVGCRADLVLVDAQTAPHAVASVAPRRVVIKGGRVVARDGALVGA